MDIRATALFLLIPSAAATLSPDAGKDEKNTDTSPAWRKEIVKNILEGALEEVENKTVYFIENRYLKTTYLDGVDQKKKVYPWGDIPPGIGVCTDLVIRALRHAGFDLQKRVHEDMKKDLKKKVAYPWGSWKKKSLDTNIDHRRCPNHKVFFLKHADVYKASGKSIDTAQFQPGDIVYWDLETGRFHIGIVSDKKNPEGIPLVIHNFPSPGYTAEEDALVKFKVLYRFRYPPDSAEPPQKDKKP
jgi:uncharacterized protein YijF (DUF1287 family)